MDICKVLAGFNPISPTDLDLSSNAINSGSLPEPSLFFTWYCEKAREIEKYTGSVEFSLKLLDLALEHISSNSRIAKRFILATRHSLIRYNAHINSLASKLDDENIPSEERASIFQTLRTIDLKTFEMSGRKLQMPSNQPDIELSEDHDEEIEIYQSSDWSTEMGILDLILQGRFDEAFSYAQQIIFFPTALKERYSSNPIEWLSIYCKTVAQECEKYFESMNDDSVQIIPPEQCNDLWSEIVNAYLGSDSSFPYKEEQSMCLLFTKSKMAQSVLKTRKNGSEIHDDDESYF